MTETPIDNPRDSAKAMRNGDNTSSLANLTAQATLKYSVKDYDAAVELYSQATELQAEINGEMSPQNADLLYAYGRCLYHVAVNHSDVLGTKIAKDKQETTKKPRTKKRGKESAKKESSSQQETVAKEEVAPSVGEEGGSNKPEGDLQKGNQPLFQFTGDENWDTSEEEDDEEDQEGEDDQDPDEEDDFVNAYEVLDLARILLIKKLAEIDKAASNTGPELQEVRQLKERLADTYDLQAEISLEGERFPTAVVDLKSALELKLALFPEESSLIAEAHYKLSLALEFSSVTQQKNDNGEIEAGKEAQVDEKMREEAAREMEAAIASCRLRVQKEETSANGEYTNSDTGKPKVTKSDIEDVREMIQEMEQRLVELRQPPVSINNSNGTGNMDGLNPLSGIMGSILGDNPAAQKAKLEQASIGAQDLTNLVKKKKPTRNVGSEPTHTNETPTGGKRKVDLVDQAEDGGTGKMARLSDIEDD